MVRSEPTKVAIYSRVSTFDKGQDPENQLLQLRDFCQQQGYQVIHEYIDYESGRKSGNDRAQFAAMLEAASQRQFDLLLFWSLDRLTREGIRKTIHYLQLLDGYGVKFKSYTEQYLDSGNELVSHILLGVMAYLANQEAVKISERTKAGLEKARRQGKRLGRPPRSERDKKRIITTWSKVGSIRATSKQLKIPYSTVKGVVDRHKEKDEVAFCDDCGDDLFQLNEYGYMLLDEVWAEASNQESDHLCIGCAEKHLGRQLTKNDFDSSLPINSRELFLKSERLLGRMAGFKDPMTGSTF